LKENKKTRSALISRDRGKERGRERERESS